MNPLREYIRELIVEQADEAVNPEVIVNLVRAFLESSNQGIELASMLGDPDEVGLDLEMLFESLRETAQWLAGTDHDFNNDALIRTYRFNKSQLNSNVDGIKDVLYSIKSMFPKKEEIRRLFDDFLKRVNRTFYEFGGINDAKEVDREWMLDWIGKDL